MALPARFEIKWFPKCGFPPKAGVTQPAPPIIWAPQVVFVGKPLITTVRSLVASFELSDSLFPNFEGLLSLLEVDLVIPEFFEPLTPRELR